jgi:X-Pro dipeptidyl-peptidase
MTGKSYPGTLCIAVAATGVRGLKTIIPEAAISSWYDYYRYNGLVLPPLGWQGADLDLLAKYCYSRRLDQDEAADQAFEKHAAELLVLEDRESGNYSDFWEERNYLNSAKKINASVFLIHGLNDWNVKTNQCFPFWSALEEHGVPKKMLLHQGEHTSIHNLDTSDFIERIHQWLDYWLYGIENHVMETIPNVTMQSNLDQELWYSSDTWPVTGLNDYRLNTESSDPLLQFTDDLSLTPYDREKNNLSEWQEDLVLGKARENAYFLRWLDPPLKERHRLSGTAVVNFEAALDKPTAIFSVMLVDYGTAKRLTTKQIVVQKDAIVWGQNTPKADLVRFASEETESQYKIITRGWLNAQNRSSTREKEEIQAGRFYEYRIAMTPTDYVVEKGHRLGLILYGSDPEATLRPSVKTGITVKAETVAASVPLKAL